MDAKKLIIPGKWFAEFDEKGNPVNTYYDKSYREMLGYESEEEYANAHSSWTNSIHPDDQAALDSHLAEVLDKHPEGMDYDIEYRMMTRWGYRRFHDYGHVTRRADGSVKRCDGVVFDIQDINERTVHLGAMPLSPDILGKASIGLWAFELDEGKAPRMYVNSAMLGLIGLKEQISPEETYHAWYDHIDEGSYPLVAEAVKKMVAGEHAEVQYPWHHPDGRTWTVRCGGVRNMEYTQGVRIEGVHQNVTKITHFQEERLAEQTAIASYFLEPFVSAYYVGLTDRTCQILRRTEELNKEYPIMTDFVDSLNDYITNDVHPDDQEALRKVVAPEYMRDKLSRNKEYTHTFRCYADGKERIYRLSVIRGADDDHTAFGFTDITGEIRLQKETQKKEEASEKLINNFIRRYNMAYRVNIPDDTYVVLKAKKMDIGRGMEFAHFTEALAFFCDNVVFEPDKAMMRRELTYERFRQHLAEKKTYTLEYRALINDVTSWHEMTISWISDDDIAIGFMPKDTEILLRRLQDKELDGYFALSAVDLDSLQIVNLKDSDLYDMSPVGVSVPYVPAMKKFAVTQEGETKAFFERMCDVEHVKRVLNTVSERTFSYKSVIPGNEGRWITVTVYVVSRNDDGSAATFTIGFSFMDSLGADRQELQSQLAEKQAQLEDALTMANSANRAKTTFLNNMSHDIRTPMNAIIGYTGLAASHIDNKERVQDYLSKIAQSSDHLLSLINDVLDMSRIESGKMNLEEKEEYLPDIIHTLRDIVQADIHSKRDDFFIDTINVNDEHIICDKLRLNQVLLNLLSNAIKYTAAGGTISMRIIEKTVKRSGYATYEFRIKDNGMGMSEDFVKIIFDPFSRVKSSTVSGIQGTGLGMAITKNIIDMMGGKIDITTELGKGTEVVVTFDFKLADGPKEQLEIPEFKGVKGLVADDDSNTCLSIAKMLKDAGMRAEWCTSGKEAVIRAQAAYGDGDLFKVYIIDWMMPDMNGIETTRRIRKVIGDDAPIIILTAYDWTDIEEEAREAGVTAFISKPMFPSDLQRVLTQCIGKHHPEETAVDAANSQDLDLSGKKVLLVEDNILNREIATAILDEYHCVVTTAEDGNIAVDMMKEAKEGDYDLVLMDIQMPTIDGYEATRQIRALAASAGKRWITQLPIVAMTANAFEEDKKAAIEAGMNEHIAKPINMQQLKEVLVKFLKVN